MIAMFFGMGLAEVTPGGALRSEMMAHREQERLVSPGDDNSPGARISFQKASWRTICFSNSLVIFNNPVEAKVEPLI
jgi:hypothetical protein